VILGQEAGIKYLMESGIMFEVGQNYRFVISNRNPDFEQQYDEFGGTVLAQSSTNLTIEIGKIDKHNIPYIEPTVKTMILNTASLEFVAAHPL